MSVVHCLILPHLAINMLKIQTDFLQLPKALNNTPKSRSNEALNIWCSPNLSIAEIHLAGVFW